MVVFWVSVIETKEDVEYSLVSVSCEGTIVLYAPGEKSLSVYSINGKLLATKNAQSVGVLSLVSFSFSFSCLHVISQSKRKWYVREWYSSSMMIRMRKTVVDITSWHSPSLVMDVIWSLQAVVVSHFGVCLISQSLRNIQYML